jgi:hypothetical protein
MLHVPDRGIEKNGVVVVCDCLFYCLIDRLAHQLVVLAVRELPYDESAQVRQYTTQAEIANHPVDMIMPLGDVFDE